MADAPAEQQKRNYAAIASLVSAVIAFFAIGSARTETQARSLSIVILLIGLTAAFLGYAGLKAAKTLGKGKGIAIAGLVLGSLLALASVNNVLGLLGTGF